MKESYKVDQNFSKCEQIRHSPQELNQRKTDKSQTHEIILEKFLLFSNTYLDLNFHVIHADANPPQSENADGNNIRIVNSGPIVFFQ